MVVKYFLVLVFFGGLLIPSAFGDTTINFSIDRSMVTQPYEKFLITGSVSSTEPLRNVQIQIFDPNGNLVYSPTTPLDSKGEFRVVPRVESSWIPEGIYTIEISNPKVEGKATGQIELRIGAESPTTPLPAGSIMVSGYGVKHNLGSAIQSTFVDPETKSVRFSLSGTNNAGEFQVTLPNELIKSPNAVEVDGVQITDFTSTKTGSATRLVIPIQADSQEVVIYGTYVVPEFGSIAAMILVVALVATIVFSFKVQRFPLKI